MKKTLVCILLALAISSGFAQDITEKGFVSIFNGRDLAGWNTEACPGGWRVEDGLLVTGGSGGANLMCTLAEYGDFMLRFEYMLSKVGNSGVMIRTTADDKTAWTRGYEIQLLAPWTPYRDDLHCTASIYGYVPVTSRPDETTGVWHTMEIVCDRFLIAIAVDGKLATWADMSKVKGLRRKNLSGPIGLQTNHSNSEQWVKFRALRVKDLDVEPDYVVKGFSYTDRRVRRLAHEAAVRLDTLIAGQLCRVIAEQDSLSYSGAKKALTEIVGKCSAPDTPAPVRNSLAGTLKAQAAGEKSEIVSEYYKWLLGLLGE